MTLSINSLRASSPCLRVSTTTRADVVEIASVRELAEYAAKSGNTVRMKPGVYRMSDYLTDDVIAAIRKEVPEESKTRPPVWMIRFSGNDNRFELRDVVLEIDTELYPKLPRGYTRCLFIPGNNNVIDGLTIRNTGPNQGSNGNILRCSAAATGWRTSRFTSRLQALRLRRPARQGRAEPRRPAEAERHHGRRSRQHAAPVQGDQPGVRALLLRPERPEGMTTDNIRIEDCYAEGVMRPTGDMLRETSGPLAELNFRTIAENRDGRFLVVAGYMKSLVGGRLPHVRRDRQDHAGATAPP